MKLLTISMLTAVFLVGCGGGASTKPTDTVMSKKASRAGVVLDEGTDRAVDKVTGKVVNTTTNKILDMIKF